LQGGARDILRVRTEWLHKVFKIPVRERERVGRWRKGKEKER
jgi:hypothetical protein